MTVYNESERLSSIELSMVSGAMLVLNGGDVRWQIYNRMRPVKHGSFFLTNIQIFQREYHVFYRFTDVYNQALGK